MLTFKNANGGVVIPIQEYDKLQKKNLKRIKQHGEHIPDLAKVSVYYPEIRLKNVVRNNDDGTMDLIVSSEVADSFGSGFLHKPFYKAVRLKKEKGPLGFGGKWVYVEMLQVPEREIIGTFMSELPIDEVSTIIENLIKEGVNYFD